MEKRNSVKKANWSFKREEWYQKECNKYLFDKQMDLTMSDDAVYLKSADKEELLLHIAKPKSMWYEIWLRLKII